MVRCREKPWPSVSRRMTAACWGEVRYRHLPKNTNTPCNGRQQAFHKNGESSPRRNAAKSSANSAMLCARRNKTWVCSSRSKPGKIIAEGHGEVQEMIDICDFAVGLSRQALRTDHRPPSCPNHRMMEQWHPLGVVGRHHRLQFPRRRVVAEHRPCCGLWRLDPLETLILNAAYRHRLRSRSRKKSAGRTALTRRLYPGDRRAAGRVGQSFARRQARSADLGHRFVQDGCATSPKSVRGHVWAARFSNSAATTCIIVTPSADMDLAVRAILFRRGRYAGQRCTSTRRIFVHESIRRLCSCD